MKNIKLHTSLEADFIVDSINEEWDSSGYEIKEDIRLFGLSKVVACWTESLRDAIYNGDSLYGDEVSASKITEALVESVIRNRFM